MKAVIHRLLNSNLNELKGLRIEGEIPVTEDFLNDLIRIYLEYNHTPPEEGNMDKGGGLSDIDIRALINGLDKKELKVELKEKAAMLKVSARKY